MVQIRSRLYALDKLRSKLHLPSETYSNFVIIRAGNQNNSLFALRSTKRCSSMNYNHSYQSLSPVFFSLFLVSFIIAISTTLLDDRGLFYRVVDGYISISPFLASVSHDSQNYDVSGGTNCSLIIEVSRIDPRNLHATVDPPEERARIVARFRRTAKLSPSCRRTGSGPWTLKAAARRGSSRPSGPWPGGKRPPRCRPSLEPRTRWGRIGPPVSSSTRSGPEPR